VKIPNRVSIRERPEDVNSRRDFGHWEGDTVVGDQHKTGVHTEVERVSRLLFAHPVPHIRAKETCLAQLCMFGSLPKQARQSTTLDNGSENYLHTQLQEELGIRTYFAHPYCSWQRVPTNIPMDCFGDTSPNGQISETLPRNSSMTLFTD
jgi:transposase, IS30 family